MSFIRKTILTATVLVCAGTISAQVERSPYSKFGYGIIGDNASSSQRAMGGVGYASNSSRNINVMNPASYASVDSLTFLFDMGVDFTTVLSKDNGVSNKDYGGGLDYVTMQFPITKNIGASIGMLPFSSIGYSFGSSIEHGSQTRTGSGGINQLYMGIATKTFKGLSVGLNASYLFGTNIADAYAYTSAGETALFERTMEIRDYRFQLGVQYTLKIDDKSSATIGAVYTPKKSLLGHTWATKSEVKSDNTQTVDTLHYISLKNNYELPHSFGLGLSYNRDKRLLAEIDFTYQKWGDAKYLTTELGEETTFSDRWKIACGVEYQPRQRGGWLQRIIYRGGLFYDNDYIKIGDSNVKNVGASLGFGLPTPGGKSVLNLGLEYKHRSAGKGYLSENFLNVTVGFKINEMWFWKNKIR